MWERDRGCCSYVDRGSGRRCGSRHLRASDLTPIFSVIHNRNMKTTVDIPDHMLVELIKRTAARTKREAILTAIGEYNRRQRIAALADAVGTFDQFMTADDLRQSRDSG